jgi:hypothetical protein
LTEQHFDSRPLRDRTSRPDTAAVVKQALSDLAPSRVRAAKLHGVEPHKVCLEAQKASTIFMNKLEGFVPSGRSRKAQIPAYRAQIMDSLVARCASEFDQSFRLDRIWAEQAVSEGRKALTECRRPPLVVAADRRAAKGQGSCLAAHSLCHGERIYRSSGVNNGRPMSDSDGARKKQDDHSIEVRARSQLG